MDDEYILSCTPPDLCESENNAIQTLLPEKSQKIYTSAYTDFTKWRKKQGINSSSETVLLAYFKEISEKYKPSSLWAIYSMLKSTLSIQEKINIKSYNQLSDFLKNRSRGFKSKKSRVLSTQNVNDFINKAPDEQYLVSKVALIFGIFGACRSQELVDCKIQDVTRQGEIFMVHIPNAKTKKPRTFTINQNYADIVQKYRDLRTTRATTDRFFLKILNGQCTIQVVGRNKFAKIPQEIAKFLKLENPELFTGHCFRRTSATVVGDSRASVTTLERHTRSSTSQHLNYNNELPLKMIKLCYSDEENTNDSTDPLRSEPQSCLSETPSQRVPDPNVETTNHFHHIEIKDENIIDIDEHSIKEECSVDENIKDTTQYRINFKDQNQRCIFCNCHIRKDSGSLIRDDTKSLKNALQMYKEFLKDSEMCRKIETLPQLYYHYQCRVNFFDNLYYDTINGSRTKCLVTKFLHEKSFKEICRIIEENVIKKGQCYSFSHLVQENTSLIKKFAEEDGRDCYLIFSRKHFESDLLEKFLNIKIISAETDKIIMPKHQTVDDEFLDLLKKKDILQKAALILRNKIFDINVSDTIKGELHVPKLLTDFYTILLSGRQQSDQSSIDYRKKAKSMAQDTVDVVSHGQLNTEKRITFGNLTSNRDVIHLTTLSREKLLM